jgi:sucrose-6-phosphate hydrolase SacC (GH32 family)
MIAETNDKILFNKDGFIFKKIGLTQYSTTFEIHNTKIDLTKIINFDLFKLIYSLNTDIYEYFNLDIINDTEAVATLLMKHFFEDLGLPQRYAFLHMKRTDTEQSVMFQSQSLVSHKPDAIPDEAVLVSFTSMDSICKFINPHHIIFTHNIYFDSLQNVPPFAEKIIGIIINKIFKRVKQFVDNI